MIEKVTRDGQVALILASEYGGGWSTVAGAEAVFDSVIVDILLLHEEGRISIDDCNTMLNKYQEAMYEVKNTDLRLEWVPEGTAFIVNNYDGIEYITTKDSAAWIIA